MLSPPLPCHHLALPLVCHRSAVGHLGTGEQINAANLRLRVGAIGHAADEPLHTVSASQKDYNTVVAAHLIHRGNGEREGQAPRDGIRRRPAWMAKALSQDLRDRVVAAIDSRVSRRGAAARFGASVSSAIRWHQLVREHGRAVARKPGGDQRSSKTDIHAEQIMDAGGARPHHVAGLQSGLAERGVSVGSAPSGGSSIVTGSRVKKDRTRDRARSPRRPEIASALVRRSA